jgi:hypothetical protein
MTRARWHDAVVYQIYPRSSALAAAATVARGTHVARIAAGARPPARLGPGEGFVALF